MSTHLLIVSPTYKRSNQTAEQPVCSFRVVLCTDCFFSDSVLYWHQQQLNIVDFEPARRKKQKLRMMTTLGGAAVGLLIAALFSFTAEASPVDTKLEARSDEGGICQWRQYTIEACISQGNVDFTEIHQPSYGQRMCSEIQPVATCMKQNREECPDLQVFQGAKGQSLDAFINSFDRLCSGVVDGGAEGEQGQGCEGGERKFQGRLERCHDFIASNYNEQQMCRQMQKMASCMEKQYGKFQSCPWMTLAVQKQVELGRTYFLTISALRYGCTP